MPLVSSSYKDGIYFCLIKCINDESLSQISDRHYRHPEIVLLPNQPTSTGVKSSNGFSES